MKCNILKPFNVSYDGIASVRLESGVHEIPDVLVAGLAADGFVGDPALADDTPLTPLADEPKMEPPLENKDAASPKNVIPDDWAELPWQELRALAVSVNDGGDPIFTKEQATAVIEGVLAD